MPRSMGFPAIRTETHRYIRYADGGEELYAVQADPYEWNNLAKKPETSKLRKKLAQWLPKKEKPTPAGKKKSKK